MIARTSFLPHLLVTLGLAGTASVLTACNGRIVSLGNTGDSADKLTSIDPATSVPTSTSTTISACPAGYAHPNICCDAAPGQEATCGEWTLDPFRACSTEGPGWSTYPNAFECCDLTNPTACMDTPVDAGSNVPTPPSPIGCGFVCPPGWWSSTNDVVPVASSSSSSSGGALSGGSTTNSGGTTTSGSSSGPIGSGSSGSSSYGGSGSCCTILADGTTECDGYGYGYAEPVTTACAGSGSSSGSIIAPTPQPGPIIFADGGTVTEDAGVYGDDGGFYSDDGGTGYNEDGGFYCEDAGSYYPPGYDGGTTSLCGECPAGWLPDSLDPLLCCQTTGDQTIECFSQATGSASGISSVSGSSSSGSTSAGSGSSSSGGGVTTPISSPVDAGVTSNGG